jgi:cyclopropane-fatty-acyl-phospholipid synthase
VKPRFAHRIANRIAARLLARVWRSYDQPAVTIVLPNGNELGDTSTASIGRIHIRALKPLLAMAWSRDLAVGDGYASGAIEIDGDLLAILDAIHTKLPRWSRWQSLRSYMRRSIAPQIKVNSARRNASAHYEADTTFYKLWLDESMTYTCAYFENDDSTLADAQLAKLDHVCRKLRLKPGERVVEAGSGWGGLAIHMARNYGVSVDCYNVSAQQNDTAKEMATDAGVADQIQFFTRDYRAIDGTYDAFVSVGMLEHVGARHYRELGNIIRRTIGTTGRGLIHTIGRDLPLPTNRWIATRIFPDGYAPSLAEALHVFEPNALSVLDVENLRLHYARTLELWLGNLRAAEDSIIEKNGAEFFRRWELYLASACAGFRKGWLQLFQLTFAGSQCNALPMTRAHTLPRDTRDAESGADRALRIVG